jgi:segregation and condensation protein A
MEPIDISKSLLQSYENFRKILLYRRENLLNLSLSQFSSQLLSICKEISFLFGDLFLEFLLKLSYALYIKSQLLLNLSEEEVLSQEEEENLLESWGEAKARTFKYFSSLLTERILEERVFLPKVNGFENMVALKEGGDINHLIEVLLNYLERIKRQPSIKFEFSERNIEDYLEDFRQFLYKERFFTWEEFLEKRGVSSLLEMVFYFLSLLFLVLYGECGVHQNERGIIQIFLRE